MGRVFYLFFSPLNTRESERERETERALDALFAFIIEVFIAETY